LISRHVPGNPDQKRLGYQPVGEISQVNSNPALRSGNCVINLNNGQIPFNNFSFSTNTVFAKVFNSVAITQQKRCVRLRALFPYPPSLASDSFFTNPQNTKICPKVRFPLSLLAMLFFTDFRTTALLIQSFQQK
jgi:hypothetical protein